MARNSPLSFAECRLALGSTRSLSQDSGKSFFGNLRKQAANALTASLPEDDRKELLDQLVPSSSVSSEEGDDEEELQHNTIAEAIAQARREEAERQESKWERERENIMAEAEEAAKARVESDLIIQQRRLAFEKWKAAVDQEKAAESAPTPSQTVAIDKEEEEEDHHPVLGKAVMDLGYKRVHLVPAASLAAIPVWKRQRIYRHNRAKDMAADKLKSLHLGLPGVISLYEVRECGLLISSANRVTVTL